MWTISGICCELQKGIKKADELGKSLAMEFREDLEKAVLVANETALEEYQAEVNKWEKNNKAIINKHESGLESSKKTRNGIGLALILCLLIYPGILLVGRQLVNIERAQGIFYSATIALLCGIPIFLFIGPLLYLGMLLNYKSNKKKQPNFEPKPTSWVKSFGTAYFDHLYGFMGMDKQGMEYWRFMVNTTSIKIGHNSDPNYGYEGENILEACLKKIVPWDYICLRGALIDKNLDADALLIGNKGIWVLESKFYSGKIILNNGEWYRKKTYFEPGGYQVSKEEYLDDFAKQWLREKRLVENILKDAGFSADICQSVKSGIVFTHPGATLSLDGSIDINVGDTEYWAQKITRTINGDSENILFSEKESIEIADAFLAHSNKMNDGNSYSLVDLARSLYIEKKLEIVMFINEFKPGSGFISESGNSLPAT